MPVRNALSKAMIRDEPFSERSSAIALSLRLMAIHAIRLTTRMRMIATLPNAQPRGICCGCGVFPCAVRGDFAGLTDAAQISLKKGALAKKGEEPSCSAFMDLIIDPYFEYVDRIFKNFQGKIFCMILA